MQLRKVLKKSRQTAAGFSDFPIILLLFQDNGLATILSPLFAVGLVYTAEIAQFIWFWVLSESQRRFLFSQKMCACVHL